MRTSNKPWFLKSGLTKAQVLKGCGIKARKPRKMSVAAAAELADLKAKFHKWVSVEDYKGGK